MRALDWLARTAMLVLAALATLALIGSLASVSNSPIGDAFPGEIVVPAQPISNLAESFTLEEASGDATGVRPADAASTPARASATEMRDTEIARWLKALTYAVIALAAVAAAGVVALVRIGSRIALR